MCGRYSLVAVEPATLRARFGFVEQLRLPRRYNVCPGDLMPVVTLDRHGQRHVQLCRWGLVPAWAGDARIGARLINARVETAASRPAFKAAMARLRCLVIADGFYEWQRGADGRPRAFWITRADGAVFAFAGLWSIWHGRGEGARAPLCSFAILTRPANQAIAPLHGRMPVILAPEHEQAWLDPGTPSEALDGLLGGLSAAATAVRRVGEAVNDPRNDSPACVQPPACDAEHGGQARLF